MLTLLDDDIWFPDPHSGDPDGLLAIGGDLSPERLLLAYSHGIFPWYDFRRPERLWFCPMDRFVIFPDEIHISHSMRTLLNSGRYYATFNHDFDGVIDNCSKQRIHLNGAWLGPEMVDAYTRLHHLGYATSVEVWRTDSHTLAGGLYGVAIGTGFFGESMFSLQPSASKFALIALAKLMEQKGGTLIDCQFETPHLLSMGGRHIPYDDYMHILHPDGH